MNTAKQNLALLPDWCWGVLPEDKSLIRIKSGETGYYPAVKGDVKNYTAQGIKVHGVKTSDELADILNKDIGVTVAQRKAMQWGSLFGWGHGAANPERWDENGNIKTETIDPNKHDKRYNQPFEKEGAYAD